MSSNLFFFLEGLCLGTVTGAGLCLWVMWKDKIAMMKAHEKQIEDIEKEVDQAMQKVGEVLRRWP